MKLFLNKYSTDPEFKLFIDTVSTDSNILMDFIYSVYLKYGEETIKEASAFINHDMLNIDSVISHFEKTGEFEKCQKLLEIKNRSNAKDIG